MQVPLLHSNLFRHVKLMTVVTRVPSIQVSKDCYHGEQPHKAMENCGSHMASVGNPLEDEYLSVTAKVYASPAENLKEGTPEKPFTYHFPGASGGHVRAYELHPLD